MLFTLDTNIKELQEKKGDNNGRRNSFSVMPKNDNSMTCKYD